MRFAQEAQVIPVMLELDGMSLERAASSSVAARCRIERELGGVHDAVVLEVEVEVVAAGARDLGAELDVRAGLRLPVAWLAARVDVQVGEVAFAQRDEVAVGAEVGLRGR